jgi:serine/threonine protein kinase/WD40 repeat protein
MGDRHARRTPNRYDDWILAYEEHVFRGAPPPPAVPRDATADEQAQLVAAQRALHALEAFYGGQGAPRPSGVPSPVCQLGDFRLLCELGRGGMGVIYEAEQLSMGRRVALKVLPLAALLEPQRIARFQHEVRAAAALDHPHIVPVYAVGEDRGVHFFAMRLIHGQSLAHVIERLRLTPQARGADSIRAAPEPGDDASSLAARVAGDQASLSTASANADATLADGRRSFRAYCRAVARIGAEAAEALHYAHERGIVHRDVIPSNLLVDCEGRLWVTDFGLARVEAESRLSRSQDCVGTFRYMAPEQALGHRERMDHRVDVYALGATLYELLLLQPARDADDPQAVAELAAGTPPVPIRHADPRVPPDLANIVAKAMEHEPTDRYAAADEFAADLRRFLDDRPVRARRPTPLQYAARWSRRHVGVVWAAVAALTGISLALGGSAVLVSASREQAARQRDEAIAQRDAAQQQRYYAEIVLAQQDLASSNVDQAYSALRSFLPLGDEPDLRDWEWYYAFSQCYPQDRTIVYLGRSPHAAWSPQGRYLGLPGAIFDVGADQLIARFNTSLIVRREGAWSPDGAQFAWCQPRDEDAAYFWHSASGEVVRRPGWLNVAWNRDGTKLARITCEKTLEVADADDREVAWSVPDVPGAATLTWSPDGKWLAAAFSRELTMHEETTVRVWNAANGEPVAERAGDALALAWSPRGDRLAVCEREQWLLIDPAGWHVVRSVAQPQMGAVAWDPPGDRLAIAHHATLEIWDRDGAQRLRTMAGHGSRLRSISWAPDGNRLATADQGVAVKLWDLARPTQPTQFSAGGAVASLSWLDDSPTLVTCAQADGARAWWDARNGELRRREPPAPRWPIDKADARRVDLVWNAADAALQLIDVQTNETLAELRTGSERPPEFFAAADDGSAVLTQEGSYGSYRLRLWNVAQERETAACEIALSQPLRGAVWSADGRKVAAIGSGEAGEEAGARWEPHAHVIDVATGQRVLKIKVPTRETITAVAWSADARQFALGANDGLVEAWDVDARKRSFSRGLHERRVVALAWHPGGKRLASACVDGEIKLATADRGLAVCRLAWDAGSANALAWSGDGRSLAAASPEGAVCVWDASRAFALLHDSAERANLAWLYFEAAQLADEDARHAALRTFVDAAPDTLEFWEARGMAWAQLGAWNRAADELAKGVEPHPEYAFNAARHRAWALLAAGDLPRYREACARLVETFGDSPINSDGVETAWACALVENPLVDGAQVVNMASRIHPADRDDPNYWRPLVLGAAYYRLGDFDQATRMLAELADALQRSGSPSDAHRLACAKYFLSMSRQAQGHAGPAQRILAEANQAAAENLPEATYWGWPKRVIQETLRREAEQAVGRP